MSGETDMRLLLHLSTVIILIIGNSLISAAEDTVRALVQTEPLQQHDLSETISSYGIVEIDPLNTESINFPRAGQVTRLLVTRGESVMKDAPLIELETSPQESVAYEQARSGVNLAKAELARVQNLLAQQLATKSQLAAAEKSLHDAEAALAAQEKLGTGRRSEMITAPFDGIISELLVKQGERIQAGATVMRLSQQDRLRVVLGIEPEDAHKVRRGMPVELIPVFDRSQRAAGVVNAVNGMINPQTGLVDLLVNLKQGRAARLMPGIRMEGHIMLASRRVFAVSRQAVLIDNQGSYIFVVRNEEAHRINVKPGIEMHGLLGIAGQVKSGDRVVVTGNYELRDGMAVRETAK
jgi:membrane fusion protein (multidrug efflux system)